MPKRKHSSKKVPKETPVKGNVFFYVDREDPRSVYKYDWDKHEGYTWLYWMKEWAHDSKVIDYIYDWDHEMVSLSIISEEEAMKIIGQNTVESTRNDVSPI